MKKLILSIFIVNVLAQSAHAIGINTSAYYDKGAIFSGSTFPQSTANAVNLPKQQKLQKLKTGYAAKTNFFGLVEIGDSGIDKAAKQANITQIHYVDTIRQQGIHPPAVYSNLRKNDTNNSLWRIKKEYF